MRVGDREPDYTITCTDNGTEVDLSAATSVRMIGMRGLDVIVDDSATTGDKELGIVTHAWAADEVDTPGRLWLRVVVTFSGSRPQTFPPYGELAVDFD